MRLFFLAEGFASGDFVRFETVAVEVELTTMGGESSTCAFGITNLCSSSSSSEGISSYNSSSSSSSSANSSSSSVSKINWGDGCSTGSALGSVTFCFGSGFAFFGEGGADVKRGSADPSPLILSTATNDALHVCWNRYVSLALSKHVSHTLRGSFTDSGY